MNSNALRYLTSLFLALAVSPLVNAQMEVSWTATEPSDWNVGDNWSTAEVPDGFFEESALIANGGTAFLADAASDVLGLDVGRDLNAGTLDIQDGGSLNTAFLNVGGAEGTTLSLAGASSLAVGGDANLSGTARITGPDVGFTVAGDLVTAGTFQAVITADSHSAVSVEGAANVGAATLQPEFDGVTPALGNSWPLVDAGSVAGNFQLDSSLAPPLPQGLIYASAVNTGEGNIDLVVTNTVDLVVDRRSGQASMRTIVGDPVEIDSYAIASPSGRLNPDSWNSFADSGGAGGTWAEGTSDANTLTESRSDGLSPIQSIEIGAPVNPSNFAAEDIELSISAAGVTIPGTVTYEGIPLTLVLDVDASTGSAQIVNAATVAVSFDGYSIISDSGALKPEDGWDSLEDSSGGGGGWAEANPNANALNELKPEGTTTLAPNESLSLGSPFDTAGTQDLIFSFFEAGGLGSVDGFVSYEGVDIGPPGGGADCNGDGVVDINDANCTPDDQLDAFLASIGSLRGDADGDGQVQFSDFAILADNFGGTGQYTDGDFNKDTDVQFPDFAILADNFGQSGGVAQPVPEPSGLVLLLFGVVAGLGTRRR